MSGVNVCHFIGRLGKDPETKTLQTGDMVANFSIAVSESYKDKQGNKVEKTEWINCVAWRKTAEVIAKWVHKGDMIYVSGKFTTRKWEKDGVTRYTTEILVNNMMMLGSKQGTQGAASTGPSPGEDGFEALPKTDVGGEDSDPDLPF